jgi:hypothetical protein
MVSIDNSSRMIPMVIFAKYAGQSVIQYYVYIIDRFFTSRLVIFPIIFVSHHMAPAMYKMDWLSSIFQRAPYSFSNSMLFLSDLLPVSA